MRWIALALVLILAGCGGPGDGGGGVNVRMCGNGTLDPGEDCDDGNQITENCPYGVPTCSVCTERCRLEPGRTSLCGDGRLDSAHEQCDDGNSVTETCPWGQTCYVCDENCARVTIARVCGDGVVDADAGEECDEGDANSNVAPDACRLDCRRAACGDGVVDSDEACESLLDPGCSERCTWIRCGDGFVDPGEACDPASGAGDGCREDCTLPTCGDGVHDEGEACDRGAARPRELAWYGNDGCLVDADGSLRCAGRPALQSVPEAVAGSARSLTMGEGFACAIADSDTVDDGRVFCWGEDLAGFGVLEPPIARFRKVSAGRFHACALDTTGRLHCWGKIDVTDMPKSTVLWEDVGSGEGFACALKDERVVCWGTPLGNILAPRSERYTSLFVGPRHACGRLTNGPIECWGDASDGKAVSMSGVRDLALAADRTCGIRESDGGVACWGRTSLGLPAPEGDFDRLFAAGNAVCGVRAGEVFCWGIDLPNLPMNADQVAGACREDCQRARCGDGMIDPGEQCDDGNVTDDGNGCDAFCQAAAVCGDGIVQDAVEQCDDGNAITETCDSPVESCEVCDAQCRIAAGRQEFCGDGMLLEELEDCDDGAPGPIFSTIALDEAGGCGLQPDGAVRCWGGAVAPAADAWIAVAVGRDFSCGLRSDGSLACAGALAPPAGAAGRRFVAVDAAGGAACALDEAGAILCWGELADAPDGNGWRRLSVGAGGACALDAGGAIHCWGEGVGVPPAGTFTSVSVGSTVHCAIDVDGQLRCWGTEAPAELPDVRAIAVDGGDGVACALDAEGRATCFGPSASPPPAGSFRAIRVAGTGACALGYDGLVRCWPAETPAPPSNHPGRPNACRPNCSAPTCGDHVTDPSLGETCDIGENAQGPDETCEYDAYCSVCFATCQRAHGVRPHCGDGIVQPEYEACDDGNPHVLAIALGDDQACVLLTDGRARCWGIGANPPPYGAWTALELGPSYGCLIDRGGIVHCWGRDWVSQPGGINGQVQAIALGNAFGCALRKAGGIVCWGTPPFPHPIVGAFEEIGAGWNHLCARAADGTIHCWGRNEWGQRNAPQGQFAKLAVGANHACALDAAGAIHCWGDDRQGQASPPPGTGFSDVVAGVDRSCAISAAGHVCWGSGGTTALSVAQLSSLALSRWDLGWACGTDAGGAIVCEGAPGTPGAALPPFNRDDLPDSCRSDCSLPQCGDGVIDTGEACDDGNVDDGDGCSALCAIE